MKSDIFQRVRKIFDEALDLPSEKRLPFIETEAADSKEILFQLKSLLKSHESSDEFLERNPHTDLAAAIKDHPLGQLENLKAGETLGNFKIVRQLGTGSFGAVYLARDTSLGRDVAIKVTPDIGEEAQTMARLDHRNIVPVYSEEIDKKKQWKVLCMPFIHGPDLSELLRSPLSFKESLNKLDLPTLADRQTLQDWETFQNLDTVESILWMGATIARALDFAHKRDVLHLDVKPANIMVTPYGQPMLADFNVALKSRESGTFGGTLRYMAPEHRAAFEKPTDENIAKIDGRADIYSLATILTEMLDRYNLLKFRDDQRVTIDSSIDIDFHETGEDLSQILSRALAPNSQNRYENAEAFAKDLERCLRMRRIAQRMPKAKGLVKFALTSPILAHIFGVMFPQFLGTLLNIGYNFIRVVAILTPAQIAAWQTGCLIYNPIAYGAAGGWIIWNIFFFRKIFSAISVNRPADLSDARKRAMKMPMYVVLGTSFGWVPSCFFFPIIIDTLAGPVDSSVYWHFFFSNFISWWIALTYSVLTSQLLMVRTHYTRFWGRNEDFDAVAEGELKNLPGRTQLFQFLAAMVPLFGAILVIFDGPESFSGANYRAFQILISGLIGSGLLGLYYAIARSRELTLATKALLKD